MPPLRAFGFREIQPNHRRVGGVPITEFVLGQSFLVERLTEPFTFITLTWVMVLGKHGKTGPV